VSEPEPEADSDPQESDVEAATSDRGSDSSAPNTEASRSRRRAALLAVAGGGVAALATPPFDLYPLMFVGLGLLGLAMREVRGLWRGLWVGLLWGAAGQLVVLRFVPAVIDRFTPLGMALGYLALVLLAFGQSVHWAIGFGVAGWLRKRARASSEIALGIGVFVSLSLPNIFVWSPAGLLSPWPVLVQLADIVGERGVSVLIALSGMLVVTGVADALPARKLARANLMRIAGGLGIVAGLLGYGAATMAIHQRGVTEGRTLRVALIHAGVPPKERWEMKNWPRILSTLRNMTAAAETTGVDMSVWPEGAYPFPLPHGSLRGPRGRRQILGGSARGPLLFGFVALTADLQTDGTVERNSFNSATIMLPNRELLPSYDKMELLWFGETVPLSDKIPWLRRAFQRGGGLIPGKELRGLTLPTDSGPVRLGVFNCYEDTLPGFGRDVAAAIEPDLLVNVTNDAWFMGSEEPELHLRLSAMRAIELRRDLVRSVNLGVPAHIDATGVVRQRNDFPLPGFLTVQASLREGTTLYARLGDIPTALLLALGVAMGWRRRREAG
jgi:apolipoprotein N-acyltransferase